MHFIRATIALLLFFGLRMGFLALIVVSIWWFVSTPSHDREWRIDYAKLPTVEFTGTSTAHISNVRDWVFESTDYPKARPYVEKDLAIEKLKKTWFLVEPFSTWDMVGHTFFSFEFENGSTIVASIEARRESDEEYSIVKGLLPYFEYMFVWTTERDMFTNTTHFAGDKLYRYPLTISLESQKRLLTYLLERTDELETHPRFYNLLTANCTNILAMEANRIKPGSVPFHYSWILTGYADTYLHFLGFIPNDIPFKELEEKSLITLLIRKAEINGDTSSEKRFSEALRKDIE